MDKNKRDMDIKTHDIFFNFLTRKKLNELLLRAEETNGRKILEDQINQRLQGISPIVARTEVSTSQNSYYCSLYINFINRYGKQIGHFTFHFSPNSQKFGNIGRLHPKNNRNTQKRYTFHFNKNIQINNSIRMSISVSPQMISSELKEPFQKCIDVFNDYFNPENDYYLGKQIFSNQTSKCYSYLINELKKSKKNTY